MRQSRPIKVLYLTDQTRLGGDTRAELLTLRGLDAQEFTVTSFCPPSGATCDAFTAEPQLAARRTPFGSDLGPTAAARGRALLGWLWSLLTIVAWALRHQPDVVFVGDRPRPLAIALPAALAGRAKLVFHPQFFYIPGGLSGRLRLLTARRADAVVCHSEHSKRSYAAHGIDPERIFIAYNPVDVDHFVPADGVAERHGMGLAPADFVVGNTSVMRAFKGQDVLIEAVALLRDEVPDLRLVLAGGGPTEQALVELTERHHLSSVVRFVGYLADPVAAYRVMDVFVMPSAEEPFGLVTIEAMACGRAVIGTDTGGTPEIVVDGVTGLLVPPGRPDELAAAIRKLHDNAPLRHRMGEQGRERASELFTAARRSRVVAGVLTGLVARTDEASAATGIGTGG